jgi:L-seryl-tRNA(Ser) seleniumtransferase
VDDLLRAEALRQPVADHGLQAVRNEIRRLQHEMRRSGEAAAWAATPSAYAQNICATLRGSHYQPVFNMTGTVIHTNLGRALLSDDLWDTLRP